eukprot:evm.model.scf_2995.2 EVM.evm.TU.scf_2995.2   scf_2995:8107-11916(-)
MSESAAQPGDAPSLLRQLSSAVRKVEPKAHVTCERYLTTANRLLQQADEYRERHNDEQLYVCLMRFASLLLETIPKHPNFASGEPQYQKLKKDLVSTYLPELEALKAVLIKKDEAQRQQATAQANIREPATSHSQAFPPPNVPAAAAATFTQSTGSPPGPSPRLQEMASDSQPTPSAPLSGGSLTQPLPLALPSYASGPLSVRIDDQESQSATQTAEASGSTPVSTDNHATKSVRQPTYTPSPSVASTDTQAPQVAATFAYPHIMSPNPIVTDDEEIQHGRIPEPTLQTEIQQGLRPVYLPADALQRFVACMSSSSQGGTVHSLGLLAGKAGPDGGSLLATKLIIPNQHQSAAGVDATGEDANELVERLADGTSIIAFILWLPKGGPLAMTGDTEVTCRAHQAVLPESCAVLMQCDPADEGSRQYRVLRAAERAEGDCADCEHVRFLQQVAVEVVDLRRRREATV